MTGGGGSNGGGMSAAEAIPMPLPSSIAPQTTTSE
jgi:hypothetical protein